MQPGQTVSSVSGLIIVSADNDSNWEDAPTTNLITNTITANRPTFSTCSWSKPCQSENTNEQLAEVLGRLANTLNSNQTPSPNTNTRETKAYIPDTFCYDSKLKGLSDELTLVLSDTRELDRVPNTK